jgi:hypothetical protein
MRRQSESGRRTASSSDCRQASCWCAGHLNVVQIAHMNSAIGLRFRATAREVEKLRVGLLKAFHSRTDNQRLTLAARPRRGAAPN